MGDPSQRFSERLECGCELHAGSWDYCARHRGVRPMTALRLMDDSETLKIRALPDGTLLLEAQLDQPETLAAGYWLLRLDSASEAALRDFMNARAAELSDVPAPLAQPEPPAPWETQP